jgi:hypothetical protein
MREEQLIYAASSPAHVYYRAVPLLPGVLKSAGVCVVTYARVRRGIERNLGKRDAAWLARECQASAGHSLRSWEGWLRDIDKATGAATSPDWATLRTIAAVLECPVWSLYAPCAPERSAAVSVYKVGIVAGELSATGTVLAASPQDAVACARAWSLGDDAGLGATQTPFRDWVYTVLGSGPPFREGLFTAKS